MSLKDDLVNFSKSAAERIPAEIRKAFADGIAKLKAAGVGRGAPKPGDKAPDFALPDATGKTVSFQELRGDGPVVLSFYRGEWCPYCNLELRALQTALPEIEALGAQVVAVSPQTPDHSLSATEKNDLTFKVLSDAGNRVARAYGLVFKLSEELRPIYQKFGIDLPAYNGDDSFELPVPATFVIGRDGRVLHAHVDADYTTRLDPEDIVAVLRQAKA